MANRYEEDSCSLMRIDTEQLEEDDQFRDVIMESDHYLLEFQKTKRHVIVYDCSHGWRFHSILRKIPEIKRYRIHYSRLNSSYECVSSLLQDQGLILDDICIQRIATFMVEHRIKYRPGSPVKVVARLSLKRREQVNRCVNYGHMDLDELEDEIGLEDFTVSVGWHFDLLDHDQETLEEEMCDSSNFTPLEEIGDWLWGEDEEDDAALVPFVAGSNSLPCYTFIGSGEETCSICLNEFSQGDKFFSAECFHNFHQTCIEGWMMKKSNCPICRKHIQIPISNEFLQVDPCFMREVQEILMVTLHKAANCEVESYWPNLFSKLVEKKNIEDLTVNVGSGGGGGAAVSISASAAPAEAKATPAAEEKKEEVKEDSGVENIFGLFDEKKNQRTILHRI